VQSAGLTDSWAAGKFKLRPEHLYVLGSVTVSDRTFGELALHLDRVERIPASLLLREVQWRFSCGKESFASERIEYDVGSGPEVDVDRETTLHLQMKDVFSGGETLSVLD